METTQLADSGVEVSRIGLGTWAIGGWMWGGTDDAAAKETVVAAVDQGITLIDTAPAYGFGHSERLIGEALQENGLRDKVALATKAGLEWSDDHQHIWRNGGRQRIHQEINDSLRRLQTEYIDLYQIHWPDWETPIDETARAMEELHQAGKIRAVGVSNFSPKQMDAFREVVPLHSTQPPYNLFERAIERDVLPYCQEHGIAAVTYGALCRGLLTGTMDLDREFPGDDLRNIDPKFQRPAFNEYLKAVDALNRFAQQQYGKGVMSLALRWLLDQPGHSVALWGARRPDQLQPATEVSGWYLDNDAMTAIDDILRQNISEYRGPEFMAPPHKKAAHNA